MGKEYLIQHIQQNPAGIPFSYHIPDRGLQKTEQICRRRPYIGTGNMQRTDTEPDTSCPDVCPTQAGTP